MSKIERDWAGEKQFTDKSLVVNLLFPDFLQFSRLNLYFPDFSKNSRLNKPCGQNGQKGSFDKW